MYFSTYNTFCLKSSADRTSSKTKYGKMSGFDLFCRGLISVRSVVDLRSACGRSSVVSGRQRGLRLESTQAHFKAAFSTMCREGRFRLLIAPKE